MGTLSSRSGSTEAGLFSPSMQLPGSTSVRAGAVDLRTFPSTDPCATKRFLFSSDGGYIGAVRKTMYLWSRYDAIFSNSLTAGRTETRGA